MVMCPPPSSYLCWDQNRPVPYWSSVSFSPCQRPSNVFFDPSIGFKMDARLGIKLPIVIDYQDILMSHNIDLSLRKRLVKSLVWSVLLYGAETWTLARKEMQRCWRKLLGLSLEGQSFERRGAASSSRKKGATSNDQRETEEMGWSHNVAWWWLDDQSHGRSYTWKKGGEYLVKAL